MKELYEQPKMEIVVFETEDIITTSDQYESEIVTNGFGHPFGQ